MRFTKKIKRIVASLQKHWKNREFRNKVLKEKRRLYLTPKKETEKRVFLFAKKKRFYYFNTLVNIVDSNKERFKLSFIAIGVLLILLSIYIVILSPYFRISPSKVIIERVDAITDINIAYKAVEGVYGGSIFLVDTDMIRSRITDFQKNIKHADISRLFPNGLKIVVESYRPQFFTRLPEIEKSYVVTSNGILVYQKENDAKLPLLDIVDPALAEAWFLDYKEGIRGDLMKNILLVRESFDKTFPGVNISKFVYFRPERELHIFLESGTKVLIRLGWDVEKQIALLKFYNDNNKDIINSGTIEYIDTRVVGKFFVCSDKIPCKKNLSRIYGDYYK